MLFFFFFVIFFFIFLDTCTRTTYIEADSHQLKSPSSQFIYLVVCGYCARIGIVRHGVCAIVSTSTFGTHTQVATRIMNKRTENGAMRNRHIPRRFCAISEHFEFKYVCDDGIYRFKFFLLSHSFRSGMMSLAFYFIYLFLIAILSTEKRFWTFSPINFYTQKTSQTDSSAKIHSFFSSNWNWIQEHGNSS